MGNCFYPRLAQAVACSRQPACEVCILICMDLPLEWGEYPASFQVTLAPRDRLEARSKAQYEGSGTINGSSDYVYN